MQLTAAQDQVSDLQARVQQLEQQQQQAVDALQQEHAHSNSVDRTIQGKVALAQAC